MGFKEVLMFAVLGVVLAGVVSGQQRGVKPGRCPPISGAGICAMTCSGDGACPGARKCCRNGCGGTVCVAPVRRPNGAPAGGRK